MDVRTVRKSMNMDQSDFGRIIGVSTQTVSNWERGQRPSPRSEEKLKKFLEDNQLLDSLSEKDKGFFSKKEITELMIKFEVIASHSNSCVLTANQCIDKLKEFL